MLRPRRRNLQLSSQKDDARNHPSSSAYAGEREAVSASITALPLSESGPVGTKRLLGLLEEEGQDMPIVPWTSSPISCDWSGRNPGSYLAISRCAHLRGATSAKCRWCASRQRLTSANARYTSRTSQPSSVVASYEPPAGWGARAGGERLVHPSQFAAATPWTHEPARRYAVPMAANDSCKNSRTASNGSAQYMSQSRLTRGRSRTQKEESERRESKSGNRSRFRTTRTEIGSVRFSSKGGRRTSFPQWELDRRFPHERGYSRARLP
jgi:hypothetical protein